MSGQVFHIVCTNMKPSTIHKFFYEGVDASSNCVIVLNKSTNTPGYFGSGVSSAASIVASNSNVLMTDSTGRIEFDFYSGISNTTISTNGTKKFELTADNSYAAGTVQINIAAVVINPVTYTPIDNANRSNGPYNWSSGNKY